MLRGQAEQPTWGLLLCWLDVVSIGILSLLCFCFGWTFIAGLLVVNLYFYFFIGLRFQAGRYIIPAQQQALPLYTMQKKIPFILIIFWFAVSCQSSSYKKFEVLISDTSKTDKKFNELDFAKNNCILLHLPEIHNGVDSFEMRIWYWGFVGGKKLIDLRNIEGKWICYENQYFSSNNSLHSLLDSSLTHSINTPKDINQIVKFFTSDSILSLPSQQSIPGFKDNIGDGQGCQIEIATKSFYKALYYHCPEHFTDQYNRRFLSALIILDKYLNFYTPWCKPVP